MRGYELLKEIYVGKINPGTKFHLIHSNNETDENTIVIYDLDECEIGALYTYEKDLDKLCICDSSIVINCQFIPFGK